MLLNSLNRDMFKPFVLIDFCSVDLLVACVMISRGFKRVFLPRDPSMRALWSERQSCSHNVSQNLKRIRRVSDRDGSRFVPGTGLVCPEHRHAKMFMFIGFPEGPAIKNIQSRSKFSISIENFDLNVSNSPQNIGLRWVACSKMSFSLEIFNLSKSPFFIFNPSEFFLSE